MSAWKLLLPVLILFGTACLPEPNQSSQENTPPPKSDSLLEEVIPPSWDTIVVGDIDHNGTTDTAFIRTGRTLEHKRAGGELAFTGPYSEEESRNIILFNNELPSFVVSRSIWGEIKSVGDLNGDKTDELLFANYWFWSCWHSVRLFSLHDNEWELIAEAPLYACNDSTLFHRIDRKAGRYWLLGDSLDGFRAIRTPVQF